MWETTLNVIVPNIPIKIFKMDKRLKTKHCLQKRTQIYRNRKTLSQKIEKTYYTNTNKTEASIDTFILKSRF